MTRIFWTFAALAGFGLPAAAADRLDDLEVTMEVLDSTADVDETMREMRGPISDLEVVRDDEDGGEAGSGYEGDDDGATDSRRDGEPADSAFEHDDDFDVIDLEDEDDFEREQGEEIDVEEPEEMDDEDDDPHHDDDDT